MLKRGDTLLVAKHPDATPHLWILVTDPDANGDVVIVNVTDFRNHSDQTIVLKEGDHPFIRKDSVVLYSDSQVVTVSSLMNALNSRLGICSQRECCSEQLLQRIRSGIFASDFTPNKIIEFCHRAWNIP